MSTTSPAGIHAIDIASPELDSIRQIVEYYAEGLRYGSVGWPAPGRLRRNY
jgi:hypothetical protein